MDERFTQIAVTTAEKQQLTEIAATKNLPVVFERVGPDTHSATVFNKDLGGVLQELDAKELKFPLPPKDT